MSSPTCRPNERWTNWASPERKFEGAIAVNAYNVQKGAASVGHAHTHGSSYPSVSRDDLCTRRTIRTDEIQGIQGFIDGSGAAGNVSDGSALSLAVNGVAIDEMVFHSFSAAMNLDGVQHALSGVDVGGEAITVGFEDLTGGGDRDYEDVVFRVETVDDFIFV